MIGIVGGSPLLSILASFLWLIATAEYQWMEKLTIIVLDHVDFGIIKAHESGIETKYMFPVHARCCKHCAVWLWSFEHCDVRNK